MDSALRREKEYSEPEGDAYKRSGRCVTRLWEHAVRYRGLSLLGPVFQFKPTVVAPVEELLYRARVCHPSIAVTDVSGKEFDETAAGAFTLGGDGFDQPTVIPKRGTGQSTNG